MPTPKISSTERLISIIEADHKVISANTETNGRLVGALDQMQNTLSLLVTQVTTSINSQQNGVPIRIFLIVVGVLVLIIAVMLGLDVTGYKIGPV